MNRKQTLAIPVCENHVSSVLDFANRLMLIDIQQRREKARSEVLLPAESGPGRAIRLKGFGIDVLICGAISQPLALMLSNSRIEVLPYVSGLIEDVLQAYLAGELGQPRFSMPGCRPGARKRFGCRRGGGRGRCGRPDSHELR